MKKMYIFTTEFPYGKSEKNFIMQELEYLKRKFDITIVSSASSKAKLDDKDQTLLDKSISVLWYPYSEMSIFRKCIYSMQALISPAFLIDVVSIIKSNSKILQRISYSLQFYVYSLQMYRWMKKHFTKDMTENSVFYSFWYYIPVMASAMLKNEYLNFKLVSRAHGFDLYNERVLGGRQPFRSYIDKRLDKVFFIAKSGLDYYLKNCNKPYISGDKSQKYKVCRMGVTATEVSTKSTDGVLRLVSCSSAIPIKRIDLIIEALSIISNIRISWIDFGDGVCLESLKDLAKRELSNKKNIQYRFAGNKPNDEIREYYRTNPVDLFITTSSTEGCPVSIQEAMAAGIPIIATSVGEIPLMIRTCGYLLSDKPDKKEISDKICSFAANKKEVIDNMRKAAYDTWNNEYNSDNNYARFLVEMMAL